jgi:hypothetical protein
MIDGPHVLISPRALKVVPPGRTSATVDVGWFQSSISNPAHIRTGPGRGQDVNQVVQYFDRSGAKLIAGCPRKNLNLSGVCQSG